MFSKFTGMQGEAIVKQEPRSGQFRNVISTF